MVAQMEKQIAGKKSGYLIRIGQGSCIKGMEKIMEEMNRQKLIGDRLYELRSQSNMTQEDLADELCVSRQSISKWELNKTVPDVEKLIQLSELYDVSMDYLVRGKEPETDNKMYSDNSAGTMNVKNISNVDDSDSNADATCVSDNEARTAISGHVRKIITVCMTACAVLSIFMLIFAVRILIHYSFFTGEKEQSLFTVTKVYEQYTKAEVQGVANDGSSIRKIVWLDEPGVVEGDYIWGYIGKGNNVMFDYYPKLVLIPFIGGIIFYILFMVFFMEYRHKKIKTERHGKLHGKKEC